MSEPTERPTPDDELARDAKRYRWLRDNHKGRVEVIILGSDHSERGSDFDRKALQRDIDVAIAAEKGNE